MSNLEKNDESIEHNEFSKLQYIIIIKKFRTILCGQNNYNKYTYKYIYNMYSPTSQKIIVINNCVYK